MFDPLADPENGRTYGTCGLFGKIVNILASSNDTRVQQLGTTVICAVRLVGGGRIEPEEVWIKMERRTSRRRAECTFG